MKSLSLLLLLLAGGCSVLGAVASNIPKIVQAEYEGLRGQKVAVMVWVDRGVRIDFPGLQLDTATLIQGDLAANTGKNELKGTSFPWEARSVVRFQREHPELEGKPATDYATRISGITRLLYVEVDDFSTRGDETVQLRRGRMSGRVRVVELQDGAAKVVYEKQGIEVAYPEKRPEGLLNTTEAQVYEQTLRAFAIKISQLFYDYEVERET
jgi:hypothetical protein